MSIFETTKNTRLLIENDYRFIRSDVPSNITKKECDWLIEHKVLTIIDLRKEAECIAKPCPLEKDKRFNYIHYPLSSGEEIPLTYEEALASYIKMVNKEMSEVIDIILNCRTGVLYFCMAGKDRTGVVSALLLEKLGFNEEYIVNDYMKTKKNLHETLLGYAKKNPSLNVEVLMPHEEYIRAVLNLKERV